MGWASEGVARRALKSMSLMATVQTSGPTNTSSTIASSSTRLKTAILWRRKRRQASAQGEVLHRRGLSGN